jgi:hypothetical protein
MEGASTASSASLDGRSLGGGDFLNLGMFGGGSAASHPSQQPSEVLVGGTGTGGGLSGLGNGFGNDSSGASGAGVPGTSFDLNDFPSLGGTSAGSNGSNELAAALRQQHQLLAHQQMLQSGGAAVAKAAGPTNSMYRLATIAGNNGNFSMATEDFPALSGGAPSSGAIGNGSSLNASSLLAGGTSAVNSRAGPSNGGSSGMYGASGSELEGSTQLEGGAGLLGGTGLAGLGGLRGLQQQQPTSMSLLRTPSSGPSTGTIGSSNNASSASAGGSNSPAGSALSGDYGLLGLLSVIRMTDADRNALTLGTDLTMLGLNLGTVDNIYSTFSSPWSDSSKAKEPHYQVRRQIMAFLIPVTKSSFSDLFLSVNSFLHATTCSPQRSKLVTCPNSSWKLCSTYSMHCQRMCYKRTQRKSCILGNGGTTVSLNFGSREPGRRTE